jgi:hypothetical protein
MSFGAQFLVIYTSADMLMIGPRAVFARTQQPKALSSQDEIRRQLVMAMSDPGDLATLRQFMNRWQLDTQGLIRQKDRAVIDRIAHAATRGSLAAVVVPDTIRQIWVDESYLARVAGALSAKPPVEASRNQGAAGSRLARDIALSQDRHTARVIRQANIGAPAVPAASTTASAPLTTASTPPPPPRNIQGMPFEQRLEEVLRLALQSERLGKELAEELRELIDPKAIAMTVVVLAAIYLSPAGPIATAISVILAGVTFLFLGQAILDGLKKLVEFLEATHSAKTEKDLEIAADILAAAIVLLGVATFKRLIARGIPRIKKQGAGPKKGAETAKPEQSAQQPAPRSRRSSPDIPVRVLKRTPTSGVPIKADPNRTNTVLGSYNQDTKHILDELKYPKTEDFGPKKGDFNLLNVPDEKFKNGDQFWKEYNEPFLRQAADRGDNIIMATKPSPSTLDRALPDGTVVRSGFGKEYDYLKSRGYQYDPDTSTMIKVK